MSTPVDPSRIAGGDGSASAVAGAPEGPGRRAQIPRTELHFGWGRRLPVIVQSEAAALLGQPVKASFYRVLVRLHRQTVRAYGRWRPLQSGMALTADVMLDKRPLIDWIFQPLLGMKQRIDAESKA